MVRTRAGSARVSLGGSGLRPSASRMLGASGSRPSAGRAPGRQPGSASATGALKIEICASSRSICPRIFWRVS